MNRTELAWDIINQYKTELNILEGEIPFNNAIFSNMFTNGDRFEFISFGCANPFWVCYSHEGIFKYLKCDTMSSQMFDIILNELETKYKELVELTNEILNTDDSILHETVLKKVVVPYINEHHYLVEGWEKHGYYNYINPQIAVGKRVCDTSSDCYKAILIKDSAGIIVHKSGEVNSFAPLRGKSFDINPNPKHIISNIWRSVYGLIYREN